MNKKILLLLITSFLTLTVARADFTFDTAADYTGEAFFAPADAPQKSSSKSSKDAEAEHHTVPPIKQLRLKLQEHKYRQEAKKYELAPTAADVYRGEVGVSDYASKDVEENYEDMSVEDIGIDSELINDEKQKKSWLKKKNKAAKAEAKEDIILDCEKVDYDTQKYMVFATGNVNVEFVKQKINLKADVITFDRLNNTIKAEGNVRILKGSQTITGDYILVDMNEENALIENPLTETGSMKIRSKKGYVFGDSIVQENGEITIDGSYPIEFRSRNRGPHISKMYTPKDETLTEDISKGVITLKAKEIVINQKGDMETISFKKPRVFRGDKVIFKTPSAKFYTNKNHDYVETSHWEVGAYRGLGVYAGPGHVFELPKGSALKVIPMLNYKSGLGIGAVSRFSSGTNRTMGAYGTAEDRFIVLGEQRLDDNLRMLYGVNAYMDEWFLGRRRPKYGVGLVYNKGYSSKDFLIRGQTSSFKHRFDAGYYQDMDHDNRYEHIRSAGRIGTTRFRYMAQASQNLFEYKDEEAMKAISFSMRSQLSSAIYGTGDTQVIGRLGPMLHMQYKRWMQDIGYYYSVFDDNTPMPVFDAYRYGKQALYLREYLRICKWLTVSWFTTINLSNDAINGRDLQENSFYFSVGPEDIKLSLGYDFVRDTLRCIVEVMMDAKGTKVEYEKLEIKQDKKAQSKKQEPAKKPVNPNAAPTQPKILQKAVVENIKTKEEVL